VLIPDYEEEDHNLAGKMSHHKMLEKLPHHYVGILSSLSHEQLPEDVDVLFSTGGFLSAHKPSFVESLIEQAKKIAGKKVFLLGKNGDDRAQPFAEHNIEIKSSVVGRARHELFNQSRIVVSRSGYTTIMDLVELQKPAILIPTPGQTEQEYLAEYLDSRRHFKASHHTNVYDRHMEEISYTPFLPPWKTKESVEKIRTIISLKINL
jgi:predicted glycosyltransferase